MKIRRIKSPTLKAILTVLALSYGVIVVLSFHNVIQKDLARMAAEEKDGKKSKGLIGEYFAGYEGNHKADKENDSTAVDKDDVHPVWKRSWNGRSVEQEKENEEAVYKRVGWTMRGPRPPELEEAHQRVIRAECEREKVTNAEWHRLHPDIDALSDRPPE